MIPPHDLYHFVTMLRIAFVPVVCSHVTGSNGPDFTSYMSGSPHSMQNYRRVSRLQESEMNLTYSYNTSRSIDEALKSLAACVGTSGRA